MAVHVVEEEEVRAVVLIHQVLIQLGVDNGGKRSSVTLVGLCGRTSGWGRRRRRRSAVSLTMMTTTMMTKMAMGEEDVEGEVDMEGEGEGRRGRGLFSSPHHSN
jgi:hypothetical protein